MYLIIANVGAFRKKKVYKYVKLRVYLWNSPLTYGCCIKLDRAVQNMVKMELEREL